jgi:hypothetical protein
MGVTVRASGAEQPDHRLGLIAAAVPSVCRSSRPRIVSRCRRNALWWGNSQPTYGLPLEGPSVGNGLNGTE